MENIFNEMKKIYNEKFNESAITIKNACLGNNTKFVDLYLAKNDNEVANRIWDNDMFSIIFELTYNGNDNYTIETLNRYIRIKPENEYLYCNHKKISFRKATGNEQKIIETFERFIKKLYETLKEEYNNDNLLESDMELVKKHGIF